MEKNFTSFRSRKKLWKEKSRYEFTIQTQIETTLYSKVIVHKHLLFLPLEIYVSLNSGNVKEVRTIIEYGTRNFKQI